MDIHRCAISAFWHSQTIIFLISDFGDEGNYDVSTMHYDGPGNVPGAPGGGYGYEVRVEGKNSADPPEVVPAAAPAVAAPA